MKLLKWLSLPCLFLLLLLVFLPQLFSTDLGNRFFFHLAQSKTGVFVSSGQGRFSWFGPQQFQNLALRNEEFQGTIQYAEIGASFWNFSNLKKLNKNHGTLKLEGGSFQFSQNIKVENAEISGKFHLKSFDFIASGTSQQNAQEGSFSLEGQFFSSSKFSLHAALHSFPTFPFDYFFSKRKWIEENVLTQTLGTWINLDGSASLDSSSGAITATLDSPNVACSLTGALDEDMFTLRKPLIATIQLTPELSQWLLRKMNPLFLTGIKANKPVRLRIETDDFSCPLAKTSLKTITIGQGTLFMDQVRCKNGSSLASVISILKNAPLSQTQEMNLCFSPLPFSLEDGILYTGRMDTLVADSIHICTWGNINLIDDQLALFLGLTGSALRKAFGIKGLRDDFVLKIPITGTTKNPKISTEGATAKITALKASETIFKDSLPGKLIKTFLPGDPDVPPARHPFPWERK